MKHTLVAGLIALISLPAPAAFAAEKPGKPILKPPGLKKNCAPKPNTAMRL